MRHQHDVQAWREGAAGGSSGGADATRESLIDSARDRFYMEGFAGVGIDRVLDDVGISKTAFYKHFESKEDLLLAVMERQDGWLRGRFRESVEACGGGPRERLLAVFDVVDQITKLDGFRGCFFVNVAMEFPVLHDAPHAAAVANKLAVHEIVEKLAEEAGVRDPRELARQVLLLIEGAYVSRQVTGDGEAAEVARRAAGALIDRQVIDGVER